MASQLHILKERHVFDPRLIPVAFSKTVRDVLKWVRTCLGAAAPLPAVGRGRNETCSGEGASSFLVGRAGREPPWGPPLRSAGEWASRGTHSGPWGRKRHLAAAPWVSLML